MAALAERFDYVLVEADGAAGRPLKAHAPWEPVVPARPVRPSAWWGPPGFGRPIAEAAPPAGAIDIRIALAGVPVTAEVTPETEAAVLAAEELHTKIYVNQVETLWDLADAKSLAALTDCPVLAGSLHRKEYFPCW